MQKIPHNSVINNAEYHQILMCERWKHTIQENQAHRTLIFPLHRSTVQKEDGQQVLTFATLPMSSNVALSFGNSEKVFSILAITASIFTFSLGHPRGK